MAVEYCTAADLHPHGVPRGALSNPGRLAASVSTAQATIELDEHGLALNDLVLFRAEAGGSLPSPLTAGVEYYAIPVGDSHFSVAVVAGGPAIALTTTGSRLIVIPKITKAAAIQWASAVIDDMLPAHVVPIVAPVPDVVRMTCAELAAFKLLSLSGGASRTLTQIYDFAKKRLDRWASGVAIRGTNQPKPSGLAVSASSTYSARTDPRGWRRFGGIS